MLVDLKQKSQVTIPRNIIARLGLNTGDKLEVTERDGVIVLTPVMVIPKSQAWFYSQAWQQREAAVDKEIAQGQVHTARNAEELLQELGLGEE